MSGAGAPRVYAWAAALALLMTLQACSGGGRQTEVSAGSPATTGSTAPAGAVATETPVVSAPDGQTAITQPDQPAQDTQPAEDTRPAETAPPRQPKKIAYPAGGAKGQVYPPSDDAFEFFSSRQCGELLAKAEAWPSYAELGNPVPPYQIYLYRAAANACLSNWDAAVADFDRLTPLVDTFPTGGACPTDTTSVKSCPKCDLVVLAWLTEVIGAYRSDPELPPILTGTAAATPC